MQKYVHDGSPCTLFRFDSRLFLKSVLVVLVTISMTEGAELPYEIVELPRPNSGKFTFQQAENRKKEILSNHPTSALQDWENPLVGFCIHVNSDDSLSVYNHWLDPLTNPHALPRKCELKEIKQLYLEIPLRGNSAGILITSDKQLKQSKSIQSLLKIVFVPSVQLFYANPKR